MSRKKNELFFGLVRKLISKNFYIESYLKRQKSDQRDLQKFLITNVFQEFKNVIKR